MFVAWKPLAYPQVPFVWVLWVVVFFCVFFSFGMILEAFLFSLCYVPGDSGSYSYRS